MQLGDRMKEKMNVEALSRAELLTLLSILEGELEAQDVVIHALRAQHRDAFVQERYGHYDLSDPFLALQRDSEAEERQNALAQPNSSLTGHAVGPNPLAVLKLVMAHCKRMQERMVGQLAATERRHKRVIADLEEEKRCRAQDCARNEDVAFMLQIERDKLLQQLEEERATVRRLTQVEESQTQKQQLSTLNLELQKACSHAQEEAHKVSQLHCRLQEETSALEKLQSSLEEERERTAQLEANFERQMTEFDTEREQLKSQLVKEKERCKELERQMEELRESLASVESPCDIKEVKEQSDKAMEPISAQTETDGNCNSSKQTSASKANGHHSNKESTKDRKGLENEVIVENGSGPLCQSPVSPLHPLSHPRSPSSTASSSLSSSPVSSPVLAKRLGSPSFHQSAYQAGVNQRFQAARHKFQTQAELEQQHHSSGPLSPRDLSPTTSAPPPLENSTAKQLARNTVTQVLSRFTSQQAGVKLAPISNSPFGTDYRNLSSPTGPKSPSSGPLSPGIRSPLTPRSERTHPPPVPPKRPGMSPTPGSPSHSSRTLHFPELSGNCGDKSGQDGAKEPDLLLSSSS